MVNFRQPNHEFAFGVGVDLISKLKILALRSLLFMQGFSAKMESSRESSSRTLWEDHEARHKSTHEVNMTPNDLKTKAWSCETPRTWIENAELAR
jgi:hypothetical protein